MVLEEVVVDSCGEGEAEYTSGVDRSHVKNKQQTEVRAIYEVK
jgi:hypothetical protein